MEVIEHVKLQPKTARQDSDKHDLKNKFDLVLTSIGLEKRAKPYIIQGC